MAYEAGVKISASHFTALKTRVKNEMNRRKGTGSLTAYAGTSYDYTTTPAAGGKILEEHIDKLVVPLSKVNFTAIGDQAAGNPIKAMAVIDTTLTTYEADKAQTNATHHCSASCSGMCTTGCYSQCTGCTGCSGTCSGGCGGCTSCSGCRGCSGGCGGCTSCSGTCRAACRSWTRAGYT